MLNNIETALNKICPLRTFRIKKYKEPWITQELLELIKDKDRLLKKAKRTKCPEEQRDIGMIAYLKSGRPKLILSRQNWKQICQTQKNSGKI